MIKNKHILFLYISIVFPNVLQCEKTISNFIFFCVPYIFLYKKINGPLIYPPFGVTNRLRIECNTAEIETAEIVISKCLRLISERKQDTQFRLKKKYR